MALEASNIPDLLHVFSPTLWHSDALIVGTEGGLRQLRQAIDKALADGSGVTPSRVEDGESAWTIVLRLSEEQWEGLGEDGVGLPYTDPMAGQCRPSEAIEMMANDAVAKHRGVS